MPAGQSFPVQIITTTQNTGTMDGDEVVELFTKILDAKVPVPVHALQGFKHIFLRSGEKKIVEFDLKPEQFSIINDKNQRVVEPGRIQLSIGGRQPSQEALTSGNVLTAELKITGDKNIIE